MGETAGETEYETGQEEMLKKCICISYVNFDIIFDSHITRLYWRDKN